MAFGRSSVRQKVAATFARVSFSGSDVNVEDEDGDVVDCVNGVNGVSRLQKLLLTTRVERNR